MTDIPLCVNNHSMTPTNIIWKNGAQAYCKICRDIREMERSNKKRNKRDVENDRFHEKALSAGYAATFTSNSVMYKKGPSA